LHRAVALGEVEGPAAALIIVDRLSLERSHVFHAIRAELLRRVGRVNDAAKAYDQAIARAENTREREFLMRHREALPAS
jgi:RNA polymerase sigma-70 factor (ECF subfamily)